MIRVTTVITFALAAILSGCIHAASQPAAAPVAGVVEDSEGGRLLTEISRQLSGTPQQRAAGQERQHYAWQAALGACMTARGATFEIPPRQASVSGVETVSVGNMLGWSLRYDDFNLAEISKNAARAGTGGNPALQKLTGAAAERWLSIQYGCEPATKKTENLSYPAERAAINEKLGATLLAIQSSQVPGLFEEYRACMNGKGITIWEGLSDIRVAANEKYSIAVRTTGSARAERWAEALAFEKAAAAADWDCRGAKVALLLEYNADRLAVWAAEHQDELDAVAARWAAMPAERDKAKAAAAKVVKRRP